jgi:hypothetical protein
VNDTIRDELDNAIRAEHLGLELQVFINDEANGDLVLTSKQIYYPQRFADHLLEEVENSTASTSIYTMISTLAINDVQIDNMHVLAGESDLLEFWDIDPGIIYLEEDRLTQFGIQNNSLVTFLTMGSDGIVRSTSINVIGFSSNTSLPVPDHMSAVILGYIDFVK